MRLTQARITDFRCITDTNWFALDDVTCLVGKNESGKSSILHALEKLNPQKGKAKDYKILLDYPRMHWSDYKDRHPEDDAKVIETKWILDDSDITEVEAILGKGCFQDREAIISKRYESEHSIWRLNINQKQVIKNIIDESNIPEENKEALLKYSKLTEIHAYLNGLTERTVEQEHIFTTINSFREKNALNAAVDVLSQRMPTFMYFSQYTRMNGNVSIDKIIEDIRNKKLSDEDDVFLAFLRYAGTDIDELKSVKNYEELHVRVEAASNKITERIFEYWTQNQFLEVKFSLDAAQPNDPAPFNTGFIMHTYIYNRLHKASVPFDERSTGFVWFFSFLVKFSQVKKDYGNVIILLDEPGHGLHGKAQADLLRYIDEKLKPSHQVIYTTHSPFMVPADHLETVRLVEDILVVKNNQLKPEVLGTKVSGDFLSRDKDSIFPLQAALGYELTQTLFIGKHTILLEGPSDILYLKAYSEILKRKNRTGLSPQWTLCPAGSVDKIAPFISLFSGNHLQVIVFIDYAHDIKKNIEKLKGCKLIPDACILTANEFSKNDEADIEDLIDKDIYIDLTNNAFNLRGVNKITSEKLESLDLPTNRIVKKIEALFRLLPPDFPNFDHFKPAEWLIEHVDIIENEEKSSASLNTFEELFKRINELLD